MRVPSTFVWGARDHLVPAAYAGPVARSLPTARQIVVPCLRHSINAVHARCLESALTELYAEGRDTEVASPSAPQTARCRPAKRSSEVGPW
jgi:pimeloyl-ACP methyl ester carboxylesterase